MRRFAGTESVADPNPPENVVLKIAVDGNCYVQFD